MEATEAGTPLDAQAASEAGPGTRKRDVPFYNPAMGLNRDLSVLLAWQEGRRRGRDLDIAEPLCGAGARALRVANEVPHPLVVHANDAHPEAVDRLALQARRLGLSHRISTRCGDAHAMLASRRFDIVDVDPYGSPMPFLDAAVRATRHDGLVLATATDTAALCGAHPRACRRRYAAEHPLHAWPWRAEVGLRILAGAVVRSAGRQDRAAEPVLCVAHGHWMRVVARIRDGRRGADAQEARMGWAQPDGRGAGVWTRQRPPGPAAGPLWGGPLHDHDLVEEMRRLAGQRPDEARWAQGRALASLLACASRESDPACPPFWLDVERFAGSRRIHTPPAAAFQQALEASGAPWWPVHGHPKGIRTHADAAVLERALHTATAKPL